MAKDKPKTAPNPDEAPNMLDPFDDNAFLTGSGSEPSFLDMDFDDVIEPAAVPPGEYDVVISSPPRLGQSKNNVIDGKGEPWLMVFLDIPSEEACKPFSQVFMLPWEHDDRKKANEKKYRLKVFAESFNIDISQGLSLIGWEGKQGRAIIGKKIDPEYGEQNYVKKFI